MSKCEKCTCKACKTVVFSLSNMQICDVFVAVLVVAAQEPGARFSKVPKLFGRISGYIFLFVSSKRKASRGMKLCSSFTSYSLYNIWKGQLYRISGSQFYQWLFGPEKFSGLSRNGHLVSKIIAAIPLEMVLHIGDHDRSLTLCCFCGELSGWVGNQDVRRKQWKV